jgi:hypothetical protein
MEARRCNSESCKLAATKRLASFDMPLATILENPAKDWQRLAYGGVRIAKRVIDVDWKKFNQDNYVCCHCSICCSVKAEENGYYIDPVCSELVNNNGNAWTNEVLLVTFRTFVGGDVFNEHVQIPELSKGKILDAVIRPVKHKNSIGEADVYWVDILTATHRKHTDLVRRIINGEMTSLSMGCQANFVVCSKCGREMSDEDKNCEHLDNEMMQYFTDKNGVKRIVSELCGRLIKGKDGKLVGDPKSVKFIEASWVERPAFTGAVLNHYISEIPKLSSIVGFNNAKLNAAVEDIFRLRVADVQGMTVLRVARAEWLRRQRETTIEKVARSLYVGK